MQKTIEIIDKYKHLENFTYLQIVDLLEKKYGKKYHFTSIQKCMCGKTKYSKLCYRLTNLLNEKGDR